MSRIQKDRDRLLAATAPTVGLTATGTPRGVAPRPARRPATPAALVCRTVPGSLPLPLYLASLVLVVCLGYAQWQLTALLRLMLWMWVIVVAGVALILIHLLPGTALGPSAISAVGVIGAASVACICVLAVTSRPRILLLMASAALTLAALGVTLGMTGSRMVEPLVFTVTGWIALTATGVWLSRTVPRTLKRISTMSRAYRVEHE